MFSRYPLLDPALLALGLLALPGLHCRGSNPYPGNTPTVSAPVASATTPERPHTALNDEQIAAITAAANDAELDQGNLARAKAKDPRIRDFAAMMVDHHSEARREQRSLNIPEVASPDSDLRTREAEAAFQSLQHQHGDEFDAAYLQLQIEEHRNVLETLKRVLVPEAKDAQLKAFLQKITPTVESHLAQAERLREEMAPGTSTQKLGPS
jgi:putative membrane protein